MRRFSRWHRVAVTALFAGALAGCGSSTESEGPGTVVLEAAHADGDDPFMASVAEDLAFSEGALEATAPFRDHDDGAQVSSTSPGLYGGSGSDDICDVSTLIDVLENDEALGNAWASVTGVDAAEIAATVTSWTPVLLSADTLVVNHGFAAGQADPFDAVLQTGTAVLVDQYGTPAVRCACGNPLLAPSGPIDAENTDTNGEAWDDFDLERVITVDPPDDPLETLTLTDIDTGEAIDVDLGGGGATSLDAAQFDNSDFEFPEHPSSSYTRNQITIVHPSGSIGCDILTGVDGAEWSGAMPGAVGCWIEPGWLPSSVPSESELTPGMYDICITEPERGVEIVGGIDGPPLWACDFEVAFSSYFVHRYMANAQGTEDTMTSDFVLPHGHSVTHQGTTCTSREDGLACETEAGHGFAFGPDGHEFF